MNRQICVNIMLSGCERLLYVCKRDYAWRKHEKMGDKKLHNKNEYCLIILFAAAAQFVSCLVVVCVVCL